MRVIMLDCDLIKEERKGEVAGVVAIEERERERFISMCLEG